jgi:hypothetical protein
MVLGPASNCFNAHFYYKIAAPSQGEHRRIGEVILKV